jgi:hypothetical protein
MNDDTPQRGSQRRRSNRSIAPAGLARTLLAALACAAAAHAVVAAADTAPAAIGPGDVVVHTALGGFILGYDVDQTGNLGLLAEALTSPGGGADVAVETFDVRTGETVEIVTQQTNSKSDWVTLGVTGNRTGLVEYEHVTRLFVDRRLYFTIDPLNANRFTGTWTPPLTDTDIIENVATIQGTSATAVMAFENTGAGKLLVFSSDVAANTFGPKITVPDPLFTINNAPAFAIGNGQAVLGAGNGCPLCKPKIGIVDLATGAFTSFIARGLGYINGIAVDPETGIACTTTEIDFSVEFYDLATQTGIIVRLPNARSQAHSGAGVQFDPVNKLFLVQQPMSSTAPSGSSIHVYDETGQLVESLNGFHLPVSPVNMALHPAQRIGYVLTAPDLTTLQSFRY